MNTVPINQDVRVRERAKPVTVQSVTSLRCAMQAEFAYAGPDVLQEPRSRRRADSRGECEPAESADWRPEGLGKKERINCDLWGGDELRWYV